MINSIPRSRSMRTILLILGTLIVSAVGASSAHATAPPTVDTASEWFQVTQDTVGAAAISAQSSNSRIWALSWSAAYNALDKPTHKWRWHGHRQKRHKLHSSHNEVVLNGTFAEAALANAVHDVLVNLVPSRAAQLDASLATTLGRLPDGWQKFKGSAAGQKAAAAELADRSADGLDFASVNQPFTPGPAVTGAWQFTPPFGPPVQAGLPNAKPFFLGYASRFRPGPAPAPGDAAYRQSYNEIKDLGSLTSPSRTAAQTDLAKWISQTSLNQYTQALKAILASAPNKSLAWKVSLVAVFHTVTADAQIAVFEAKYHYLRWRPITAIRAGDTDGDSQTAGDAAWTPLLNPPQHPEYPSGHLTYAGAAKEVLTKFVGPNAPQPFTATSPNAPGLIYTYGPNAWTKLVEDNDNGRVWSGIHFRFSDTIGAELGKKVANYDLHEIEGRFLGF